MLVLPYLALHLQQQQHWNTSCDVLVMSVLYTATQAEIRAAEKQQGQARPLASTAACNSLPGSAGLAHQQFNN
jgi:hypothetical protein